MAAVVFEISVIVRQAMRRQVELFLNDSASFALDNQKVKFVPLKLKTPLILFVFLAGQRGDSLERNI